MGIGNETITITEENQKEFIAPYVLEEDEITLLTGGFENRIALNKSIEDEEAWLLDVVNAYLTPYKLTVTTSLTIDAEDEDQAIEVFASELEEYELRCLEFKDTTTNEIYYIEVESIHNDKMEFDVID